MYYIFAILDINITFRENAHTNSHSAHGLLCIPSLLLAAQSPESAVVLVRELAFPHPGYGRTTVVSD